MLDCGLVESVAGSISLASCNDTEIEMRWTMTAVFCSWTAAAAAQTPPSALDQPGDEVVLRTAAKGVQVYECRTGTGGTPEWVFREPRADLFVDGRPIGRHFAGPTWEDADGSRIVGKVVASAPAPQLGAIPWLRLAVASRAGTGTLTPVTIVKRVDTVGGVLSGACPSPGTLSEVPYTADYVMVRTAP